MPLIKLQIGKNKLTEDFLGNLKLISEKSKTESIRISILKTATRDRKELKDWESKILKELGKNFTSKTIGWTIVIRKWRRAQ